MRVVKVVYDDPLSVQSDLARAQAQWVAAAASLGYITTESPDGFGRRWRLTADGIYALKEWESC